MTVKISLFTRSKFVNNDRSQRDTLARWVEKITMAAAGSGIRTNIEEAYKYLTDQHEPNDRVYLLGTAELPDMSTPMPAILAEEAFSVSPR